MSLEKQKQGVVAGSDNIHIRLVLTSRKVQALERVAQAFVVAAKKKQIKVKGVIRMPTKVLRITTRKSPCGNGTNTFDKFELRIHKRVVDVWASADKVQQITDVDVDADVDIVVTVV